jgi:hypothetical protein
MDVAIACVVNDKYSSVAKARLTKGANGSRDARYRLIEDPAEADLVLVISKAEQDPFLRFARRSYVYKAHREKCIVVSEGDNPLPLLPGIYAGVSQRFITPGWVASGPYIEKLRPSELEGDGVRLPIEYLYSFSGSIYTHPVREQVLQLVDDRALLRDTGDLKTSQWLTFGAEESERLERRRSYDLSLAQSAFVLCPRGISPASVRFFETLRAGRVPVVISDQWQLPVGPDWEQFVVRIPESRIAEVPARLRELEGEASERGRLARLTWDQWFADEVLFDRVVEQAIVLQKDRGDRHYLSRLWRRRLFLSPSYVRVVLRDIRYKLLRGARGGA